MNNSIELSNYWDDFKSRVNKTIDCIKECKLPKLERLTVHITESCNFRCKYCNMCFSQKTMSEQIAKKIIDEYIESGGNIIHFTGGEPSVIPYINNIFKYAKSKELVVSTNTNGYKRIDTNNVDKLKASFDTPFKTKFNETMGRDCFDQVVENMKYYSEMMKNKMLSITAVLNKQTYKDMLHLAQFVQDNFKVYNLYYSNYKGDNKEFAFTNEEINDMFENYIPKVLEYFKATNNEYSYKQLSLYKPKDFINDKVRFGENKIVPCYIQLSEMTIDVDGYCHNCSHLYRDKENPSIMINVNENHLNECFNFLKQSLNNNYTYLSCKCLSGCNTNLIGFNKAVNNQEYI